jgi:predicted nucleic acid-binding protein
MTGYVIDASVAVKWFVAEEHSNRAKALLRDGITRVSPELVFAEVGNALWAMCRRGNFSEEDYAESMSVLKAMPLGVPVAMSSLIGAAARLALDLDHPVYDCIYLALALQEGYPVVTADRLFHDAVKRHPYLADRIMHVGDVTSGL